MNTRAIPTWHTDFSHTGVWLDTREIPSGPGPLKPGRNRGSSKPPQPPIIFPMGCSRSQPEPKNPPGRGARPRLLLRIVLRLNSSLHISSGNRRPPPNRRWRPDPSGPGHRRYCTDRPYIDNQSGLEAGRVGGGTPAKGASPVLRGQGGANLHLDPPAPQAGPDDDPRGDRG